MVIEHEPRGFCPYCYKEMALKNGRAREHTVTRTTRSGTVKAYCKGVGAVALKTLPQDEQRRRDRGQEIGHIASLHPSTVQRAPELVRGARRRAVKRTAAPTPAAAPALTTGVVMGNKPAQESAYCGVCLQWVGLSNKTGNVRIHKAPVDLLNTEWTSKNTHETSRVCRGYVEQIKPFSLVELNKLFNDGKKAEEYKDSIVKATARVEELETTIATLEKPRSVTDETLPKRIEELELELDRAKARYDEQGERLRDEIETNNLMEDKIQVLEDELAKARRDVLADAVKDEPDVSGTEVPIEDTTQPQKRSEGYTLDLGRGPTPDSDYDALDYVALLAERDALVKAIPEMLAAERRRVSRIL